MGDLFILIAIDVAGLAAIWFFLRARIRRSLELEGLLAEARKEIRLLSLEINETTDRNITLVEDRLTALRELLAEADRRMGVMKRETGRRQDEREVYNRLGKRVPLVPGSASAFDDRPFDEVSAARVLPEVSFATDFPADSLGVADGARGPSPGSGASDSGRQAGDREPVRLSLGHAVPEIPAPHQGPIPGQGLRERALELHRGGFSADIIAARLGATISEIDLLVSLEEGRLGSLAGDDPIGGGRG